MLIKGHAAIVTGGGSGLGAATARALAGAGAKVALLDINDKAAGAVAAEIGGLAVHCNVADAANAETAIGKARAAHGAARILVNCAGIGPAARIVGRDGPMALEAFRQVIEINLIGSFNLMRLAAADMIALDALADGERGIIISTASVAAYEGQIGQAAYSASKGAASASTPSPRGFSRPRCSSACRSRCRTASPPAYRSRAASARPRNTRSSSSTSSTTRCSTARPSASTVRCGWRRNNWRDHGTGPRSRSGAISSTAWAKRMSRSLSPSTSSVIRNSSTRS